MNLTLSVPFGVELCVLEAARVAESVTDAVIVLVGPPESVLVFVGATEREGVDDAVPVLDDDTDRV